MRHPYSPVRRSCLGRMCPQTTPVATVARQTLFLLHSRRFAFALGETVHYYYYVYYKIPII